MAEPDFTLNVQISFGHCDPAGIVFYPNYFRWFDRCFHTFLTTRADGHRKLCQRLGAVGIGLMDVSARFTSPAFDGDLMSLRMTVDDWGRKTLRLRYDGLVGDRSVVLGTELRGLFLMQEGKLRGGDMAPLRAILQPDSKE